MITFLIISLLINVALSVYDNNFYSILLNHTRQLQSTYQNRIEYFINLWKFLPIKLLLHKYFFWVITKQSNL